MLIFFESGYVIKLLHILPGSVISKHKSNFCSFTHIMASEIYFTPVVFLRYTKSDYFHIHQDKFNMSRIIFLFFALFVASAIHAQKSCYWQQEVHYRMEIDMHTETHRYDGKQWIEYINHSPDTLTRLYFHLYFNAFQPGSMMDIRNRTIEDPDKRIGNRISLLKEDETGYQHIRQLTVNGNETDFDIDGTIMLVKLSEPILPGQMVRIYMDWEAQVPIQIRRSGRNNREGIDYTMTQWYPKLAEYDKNGWHPNPYIGREFYGVWGSFDVTIRIDSSYTVAGTGTVLNPGEVGHGYGPSKTGTGKLSWHFKADNVHDFAWAADPDYRHDTIRVDDRLLLHFFYQTDTLATQWREVQPEIVKVFKIMNHRFGRYPYSDFSVIQGGDGGMEYPMCTMVLGHGKKWGKIGLIAHESIHNWYYGVLANNEFQYPWMDEGMTTFAEEVVMDSLRHKQGQGFLSREYENYLYMALSEFEEPMSTPADLYDYNTVYSINAYSKGAITLNMLRYIMGEEVFYRAMKRYFEEWKFKHPAPDDFFRIMEKTSGIELDWFVNNWIYTLHHIDYSIEVEAVDGQSSKIIIQRKGSMPMPLEVVVKSADGRETLYYIPLSDMHGKKAFTREVVRLPSWKWVYPEYEFIVPVSYKQIVSAVIDPDMAIADINPDDNFFIQNIKAKKRKKKK